MTTLIFFLVGIAMIIACAGRRDIAIALFSAGFVLSVVWLGRSMTGPLAISL